MEHGPAGSRPAQPQTEETNVRFMMLVKGDRDYEQGAAPPPPLMEAIAKLGAEMAQAGRLLEMGGLAPSSAGALLQLENGVIRVTDGPFAESKEVIGGYAIMRADSRAEAIELARRFLQVHADVLGKSYRGQVEVRLLSDPPGQA
jgi:hypothetical protein